MLLFALTFITKIYRVNISRETQLHISAAVTDVLGEVACGGVGLGEVACGVRGLLGNALGVISSATMNGTGRGVILMRATVSPHIVAVIGRRKSTPHTSRTKSPASTLPFLKIDEPGWISLTDITRTIPSVPRFNLIPI